MKLTFIAAMVVASVMITPHVACAITVGELEKRCALVEVPEMRSLAYAEIVSLGTCLSFINAALSYEYWLVGLVQRHSTLRTVLVASCPPAEVGQLARVFLNWTRDHPESSQMPAILGLRSALVQTFPFVVGEKCPS